MLRFFETRIFVKTIGNPAVQSSSYMFAVIAKMIAPINIEGNESAFSISFIFFISVILFFSEIDKDMTFFIAKKSFILTAAMNNATIPAIVVIAVMLFVIIKKFSHADMKIK